MSKKFFARPTVAKPKDDLHWVNSVVVQTQHKCNSIFGLAQNIWTGQNIFGPVEGQGIKEIYE